MYTIVVASGTSQRFGSDKLSEKISNESILDRTVRIALENSDGVVVVTDPSKFSNTDVFAVVSGGQNRTESVKNGLAAVPESVGIIAVQDGARPGADALMYRTGRELVERGAIGAIPAIEVVDTIKQIDDDSNVERTIPRSTLRAIQTPQIFKAEVLRQAYKNAKSDTDDSALVESLGHKVVCFSGSERNRKVTNKKDLDFLRRELLSEGYNTIRVGSGYDIHPFSKNQSRKLILAGVEIDHIGLEGHSDSDAVSHALTDALLSSIGAPDLGTLFPASDFDNKDKSSLEFLETASTMVANEGYILGNASIIVNAQQPKLAQYLDEMAKRLENALSSISNSQTLISITPKHGEGIGEIGRSEAIAVYATVLVVKSAN